MQSVVKKFLSNDFFLPFAGSRRFIFLYHDVSEKREKHFSAEHYSTTIDNFKRQINLLARKFEIIPLDALVGDRNLSEKKHYAAIIFDDGFRSVVETAQKILAAEKLPFAVFVNKSAMLFDQLWVSNLVLYKNDEAYLRKLYGCLTDSPVSFEEFSQNPVGIINESVNFDKNFRENYPHAAEKGGKKTYLDAEEVRQLHADGVLIGSHSADHFRLNNCTDEELLFQIDENKRFLEDLLKTRIEHFAIPFGKKEHYNKKILERIFALGHNFVYTTNPIPFKREDIKETQFLVPRIGLLNESPTETMFYINRTFLRKYSL